METITGSKLSINLSYYTGETILVTKSIPIMVS